MKSEEIKNIYNKKAGGGFDYEKDRWFKNDIQIAGYEMSRDAIMLKICNINFTKCLEVGPGHGTWTKLLISQNPNAEFDLIDISKEMLAITKKRFQDNQHINYFESDFLEFNTDKKYDFFFSSRAIEYMPEKEKAVKKISELLKSGSAGVIITKTPKYWRYKISGRDVPEMHKGQISSATLKQILGNNGFGDVKLYPSIMIFPIFNSPKLNKMLFKVFGKFKLNFISRFFSESYLVFFKK